MLHWLFGSIFFFSNDTTVLLSFEGMPMMDDCSFSDSFRGSFEFLKRLLNEWCTRVRECVYVCWCVCMYRCLYRCPALPFYYSQFFEEEVLEELLCSGSSTFADFNPLQRSTENYWSTSSSWRPILLLLFFRLGKSISEPRWFNFPLPFLLLVLSYSLYLIWTQLNVNLTTLLTTIENCDSFAHEELTMDYLMWTVLCSVLQLTRHKWKYLPSFHCDCHPQLLELKLDGCNEVDDLQFGDRNLISNAIETVIRPQGSKRAELENRNE